MQGQSGYRHQALLDTALRTDPIDGPALLGQEPGHRQSRIDVPTGAPRCNEGAPRH